MSRMIASVLFAALSTGLISIGSAQQDGTRVESLKLHNLDAVCTNELLLELFPGVPGDQSAGENDMRLKTAAETVTNSIICSGPDGDLQVIENLLQQIDQAAAAPTTHVTAFQLKNAAADDVEVLVRQWLRQRDESHGNSLSESVNLVSDHVSNSLVVLSGLANADRQALFQAITELDAAGDLVKIKAVVKKTVDGKTEIVGTPHVTTIENYTGSVNFGSGQESYAIELTPNVIRHAGKTGVRELKKR